MAQSTILDTDYVLASDDAENLSSNLWRVSAANFAKAEPFSGRYGTGSSFLPTAALHQTVPRHALLGNATTLSTGRMTLVRITLPAGTVVSNITFVSATTALGTGTHQWFALYDANRALLAVTANDTSTAWSANTAKTLAIASPYTITTTGDYYLGINVTASTVPTLLGVIHSNSVAINLPPIVCGYDGTNTGLTTPAGAPATAAALTALAVIPYAYVS